MRALTPALPTASSAGAVTPITMRAATAPGLPYRHTIISTNGTDRSDRWVTSGSGALSAHLLVDQRGRVTDADVDHVRRAGYSDGEINEIVANVALSIFTNFFNHGAETEIDFPTAPNP